jgi:hypothetical protein
MGELTAKEATSLWTMRVHWQDAYKISLNDGTWSASPLDAPAEVLTGDSAAQLNTRLQEDFAERLTGR